MRSFRYGEAEGEDMVGVVTGLAWTEVGGEILTIESRDAARQGQRQAHRQARRRDEGERRRRRSATCAAAAISFGIKPPLFEKRDIHVHVPEGATPKDGPSAGVAMATSIVSVLTGIPVRRDVAMTGEITLRGRVLPIGGLKEKLLAALRAGITTVFIPKENEKDLAEIPDNVKKHLKIVPVAACGRGDRAGAGAQAGADRVGGAGRRRRCRPRPTAPAPASAAALTAARTATARHLWRAVFVSRCYVGQRNAQVSAARR